MAAKEYIEREQALEGLCTKCISQPFCSRDCHNHKCPPGYAEFFTPNCAKIYGCAECWLDWLKQEVEE